MSTCYDVARQAIDSCHRKDPAYQAAANDPSQRGKDELSYADGVEKWAAHMVGLRISSEDFQEFAAMVSPSDTSDVSSITRTTELLKLAARCQHLERFLTPRATYPEGKAGYLKWRRDLYKIQGNKARDLLLEAGLSDSDGDWVYKWVSKTELNPGKDDSGDMGTQLLEDAAVLVFLEAELEQFAAQHSEYPESKFVDIIKKTWRKLSPLAKEEALKISMPIGLQPVVLKGIGAIDGTAQSSDLQGSAEEEDNAAKPEERKKTSSSSASYSSSSLLRALRPKTAAEAEAMLAARANDTEPSSTDMSPDLFGARLLKDDADIWDHNAWDHVEPPAEHYDAVAETLARQAETKLSLEEGEAYHEKPAGYWDVFYSAHENRFFKDRKWLHLEFPELVEATHADAGERTVLEVGCGAGNTVFPLLEINKNPNLRVHACDYSAEAVSVVRSSPLYKSPPGGAQCVSTVWDLSSPTELPVGLQPGSVDIIVLIFVFSALHPREWEQAVRNIKALLRPKKGLVLFRDYGRYDLPQLRFKKRRMLQDNFYLRGDGTRVYFFEPEEIMNSIFKSSPPPATVPETGLEKLQAEDSSKETYDFETLQMAVDRRLIVNRKERKRMYRVWLQAKFRVNT